MFAISKCVYERCLWAGVMLCGLVALTFSSLAYSEALYSATVPVSSKSPEDRQLASTQALEEVLLKITGDRSKSQQLVTLFKPQMADLLQQFNYLTGPKLSVQFDGHAIRQLLSSQGVAVWGNKRPLVMAWVVVDQNGKQTLLTSEPSPALLPLSERLSGDLSEYALSLVYPLMDLTDQSNVSKENILQLDKTSLQRGAERYDAEAILVGRIRQSLDGRWLASWNFWCDGEELAWSSQAFALKDTTAQLTDKLVKTLVSHYAVSPAIKQGIDVVVQNVKTIKSYAAVLNYFKHLDIVTQVQLRQVDADTLNLQMNVKGGRDSLLKTIRLDRLLVESASEGEAIALRLNG